MTNEVVIDYEKLSDQLIAKASGRPSGDQRRFVYDQFSMSYKAVGAVTSTYGHGPGGLFSMPGLSRPVFSAMLLPAVGIASRIPARPSMDANPLYGIFTGVTATTGSEPTDACADPPTAGLSKLCMHTFVFGRQSRQTRAFDIDRMGIVTNRGEFLDLQLMNNPFEANSPNTGSGQAVSDNPFMPTSPINMGDVLRNEAAKAIFELGVSWARDFARETYTGNPVNNTGARKYYYGLDILINTGYRDAESGTLCPAADSLINSFDNNRVDLQPSLAVTSITYMYRNLKYIAEHTGLTPVKWVLSMRFGLFYELTQVWPIAYYTTRNTVADANQSLFNNGKEMIELRDQMRNGQYLLIDGEQVEVVLDESITETQPAAGVFSSTIYFVPLTVLGGTPVTYWEHVNYNAPGGAMEAAAIMAPDGSYQVSDGGRFLWHRKPPANFCVQMVSKTEPRLLLLTPQIAGRLTNIRYAPFIHERGSFTDDGYYVDGGRTDRLGYPPSLFSPTS
jgi:hypothetical protein